MTDVDGVACDWRTALCGGICYRLNCLAVSVGGMCGASVGGCLAVSVGGMCGANVGGCLAVSVGGMCGASVGGCLALKNRQFILFSCRINLYEN